MVSVSGTGDGTATRRKFWGWGLAGEGLAAGEIEQLGATFARRFGIDGVRVRKPPRVDAEAARSRAGTTRSTRRARPGRELGQWDDIKLAASEAILALGGTITHHRAVERDHRRWYLREVPQLFTAALRGAKAELDPAGIMNPVVFLRPAGAVSYSHEGDRR